MRHWATDYISKKWERGAVGPNTFDCWGLICHRVKALRNHDLPAFPNIDPKNIQAVGEQMMEAVQEGGDWLELDKPKEGCVVGLGRSIEGKFHHCGIYSETRSGDGLVIHCTDKGGVVMQHLFTMRSAGWKKISFFWHKDWS